MGNNYFELNLEGDAFNALKSDFNSMLRQVLHSMEQKEAEDGTLNIKLDISLLKENVQDFDAEHEGAEREIIIPKFKHNVTSTITYKDKKSGFLGGNFELVWDKTTGSWILREITNGQTSLFDDEKKPESSDAKSVDTDIPALAPHQKALPPGTDDVIDVDCTVVDDDEPGAGDDYGYEPAESQVSQ